MEGFDPSLSLKNKLTKVLETKKKKGYSGAFAQLLSGRQSVLDDIKGFLDQRVELNQEIQAKVAERHELTFESGEFDAAHGVGKLSVGRFVNRSCDLSVAPVLLM